jgi:hypothetical protein
MKKTNGNQGKELFDFIAGITENQTTEFFDSLTESERKKYKASRYMIHRFLSMNSNYLPVVDELQKYTGIPDRCHYLFLTNILPRGRQFNKYIKGDKEGKYEKWLVDLVAKHFQVSTVEATQYIEIYYLHDKSGLRELCEKYGVDSKTLKKVKL